MSIFDNHIQSVDDVVMSQFNLRFDPYYEVNVLVSKEIPVYYRKKFVPADIIWELYMDEGRPTDKQYGIRIRPNKNKFIEFIRKYRFIEKVGYKGVMYYSLSNLWDLYDAYNEILIEDYMRARYDINQEDNEF